MGLSSSQVHGTATRAEASPSWAFAGGHLVSRLQNPSLLDPFPNPHWAGGVAPTTRRNQFESRRKMPGMTKRLWGSSGKPGAVRTVIRVGRSGRNLASSSLWGNVYLPGSHGLQTSFSNIQSFKGWYVIHICTSPIWPLGHLWEPKVSCSWRLQLTLLAVGMVCWGPLGLPSLATGMGTPGEAFVCLPEPTRRFPDLRTNPAYKWAFTHLL